MSRPTHSLATLEFDILLERLASYAQTPMAYGSLKARMPIENLPDLRSSLERTRETELLRTTLGHLWDLSGIEDPRNSLETLAIHGARLEPMALLEIAGLCSHALAARELIVGSEMETPLLNSICNGIPKGLRGVIEEINRKILPGGEIADNASPELARLRREVISQRNRVRKIIEEKIRKAGEAIQEDVVTVRNERFVLMLKTDFRGAVGGVAHGYSSSGSTTFLEPLEAVEGNNELQNLKEKELREIDRILVEFTKNLRENLPAIESAVAAVTELDTLKAIDRFIVEFDATVPQISTDEELTLIEARHPLLEERIRNEGGSNQIVPATIRLSASSPIMVISGPNAGGKTVVLKTAGLLSLMALSGLPVPAKAATVPHYKNVLADIGDHQSLSANLSTFSSHISNIASMMESCSAPSLVLLDEVGTGTDPDEGSALGVAIVDHFRRALGAHVMVSTHFRGLKIYASEDESVVNASVEFEEKTLKPTYRLLTGFSGSSSGIEIAGRFGIPHDVLNGARVVLQESERKLEAFLSTLQKKLTEAEDLRRALEEERDETAVRYSELEQEFVRKDSIRTKDFEKKLSDALAEFDRTTRDFLKTVEDKVLRARLERERDDRKAKLKRSLFDKIEKSSNQREESKVTHEIDEAGFSDDVRPEAGMKVMTSLGQVGVIEHVSAGKVRVRVGSLSLNQSIDQIRPLKASGQSATNPKTEVKQSEALPGAADSLGTTVELNLIGMKADEAEYELDKFLDEAFYKGDSRVRIIHGHGTGRLKKMVHEFLKGSELVSRFGFADADQGGSGATIAELAK